MRARVCLSERARVRVYARMHACGIIAPLQRDVMCPFDMACNGYGNGTAQRLQASRLRTTLHYPGGIVAGDRYSQWHPFKRLINRCSGTQFGRSQAYPSGARWQPTERTAVGVKAEHEPVRMLHHTCHVVCCIARVMLYVA